MPQFDLFIWFSLSFWTIFFFELTYLLVIYYIAAPFSNLQKTLIKLYILKSSTNLISIKISILKVLINIYFSTTNFNKNKC
jgi:hypothetical protein